MILTEKGQFIEYEGGKYAIGDRIQCMNGTAFENLYGTIKEIREGSDKETKYVGPEKNCTLDMPVMEKEVEEFEKNFYPINDKKKLLRDNSFDDIVLSTDMLRVLPNVLNDCKRISLFEVIEDLAYERCGFHSQKIFSEYDDALVYFHKLIQSERKESFISKNLDNKKLVVKNGTDYIEAYIDGKYTANHYKLQKVPIEILTREGCTE